MKMHVNLIIASLLVSFALVVIPRVSFTQPPPPAVKGGSIEELKNSIIKRECEVRSQRIDSEYERSSIGHRPCRWNLTIEGVDTSNAYPGGWIDVTVSFVPQAMQWAPNSTVISHPSLVSVSGGVTHLHRMMVESSTDRQIRARIPADISPGRYQITMQHVMRSIDAFGQTKVIFLGQSNNSRIFNIQERR
ncbi:MAG: hypothetical protein ABFD66_09145 [Smithella sp.]